jgi:nicotinic acid phosphoribosyltransferase
LLAAWPELAELRRCSPRGTAAHRWSQALSGLTAGERVATDPQAAARGRAAVLDRLVALRLVSPDHAAEANAQALPPRRAFPVAADHAAFAFSVHLNFAGGDKQIDVIDTFRFNDANQITEMRAFWGPGNMVGF